MNLSKIANLVLDRKIDANKGDFGHILIIGGDDNMGGAVIMAAEAAYRIGAGRVTVLTKKQHLSALISRVPNAMSAIGESEEELQQIIDNKTIIAIGPGLGQSSWSHKMFDFFMKSNLPKIIDADALNLLSKSKNQYNLNNSILTPHPKEAARLLNKNVADIQNDRKLAIMQIYKKYQAAVVLKGNGSLILENNKELHKCQYGNPFMAIAGMGDVLTGLIAGLMAQNLPNYQAAILGTNIHALAGDLAKKDQKGGITILPTDLMIYVKKAFEIL